MVCKFQNIFLFLVLFLCFSVVLCEKSEKENENENMRYEEVVEREKKLMTTDHDDAVVGGLEDDPPKEEDKDDKKDEDKDEKKDEDKDDKGDEGDEDDKKADDKPALFEKTLGIKISTKGLDDLLVLAQNFLAWKASLFSALFSSISPCMKKNGNGKNGNGKNGNGKNGNGKNGNGKNGKNGNGKNGNGKNGKGPNGDKSEEDQAASGRRRLQSAEGEVTEEEESSQNLAGMEARFDIGLARGNANLGFGTLQSFIDKLNELVNASVEGPEAFRDKFNEFFGTNINLGDAPSTKDDINDVKEDQKDDPNDVKEDQINALRETVFSSLHQDFQLLSMLLPPTGNDE